MSNLANHTLKPRFIYWNFISNINTKKLMESAVVHPVSMPAILISGIIIDYMLLFWSAHASVPSPMFFLLVSAIGLPDWQQRFVGLRKRQIFHQNRSQGLPFPVAYLHIRLEFFQVRYIFGCGNVVARNRSKRIVIFLSATILFRKNRGGVQLCTPPAVRGLKCNTKWKYSYYSKKFHIQ